MEVVPSTALSYPGSALAYVDDEHFAYIMGNGLRFADATTGKTKTFLWADPRGISAFDCSFKGRSVVVAVKSHPPVIKSYAWPSLELKHTLIGGADLDYDMVVVSRSGERVVSVSTSKNPRLVVWSLPGAGPSDGNAPGSPPTIPDPSGASGVGIMLAEIPVTLSECTAVSINPGDSNMICACGPEGIFFYKLSKVQGAWKLSVTSGDASDLEVPKSEDDESEATSSEEEDEEAEEEEEARRQDELSQTRGHFMACTWAKDNKVYGGNADGTIGCFNAETGELLDQFSFSREMMQMTASISDNEGPVEARIVGMFNTKTDLIVTTSRRLVYWIKLPKFNRIDHYASCYGIADGTPPSRISACACSPTYERFVVGTLDGTIHSDKLTPSEYNSTKPGIMPMTAEFHSGWVLCATTVATAANATEDLMATGGSDGTLRFWFSDSGKFACLRHYKMELEEMAGPSEDLTSVPVTMLATQPGHPVVAVGLASGQLSIVYVHAEEVQGSSKFVMSVLPLALLPLYAQPVTHLEFHPTKPWLAVGSADEGLLYVVDCSPTASFKVIASIECSAAAGRIAAICWYADKLLVSTANDGVVRGYVMPEGPVEDLVAVEPTPPVCELPTPRHPSGFSSLIAHQPKGAPAPTGLWLSAVTGKGIGYAAPVEGLVEAVAGETLSLEVLNEASDHQKGVSCMAVSPLNDLVLSGGLDGRVSLWSIGDRGATKMAHLQCHSSAVVSVSFTGDARAAISVALDGSVLLHSVKHKEGKTKPRPISTAAAFLGVARKRGAAPSAALNQPLPLSTDTWKDEVARSASESQAMNAQAQLSTQRNAVAELAKQLQGLLQANNSAPDIEKMDRDEFVIDLTRRDATVEANKAQAAKVRSENQANDAVRDLVTTRIRHHCVDTMEVQAQEVHALQKAHCIVANFPIRKLDGKEAAKTDRLKRLRVLELRQLRHAGVVGSNVWPGRRNEIPDDISWIVNEGQLAPRIDVVASLKESKAESKKKGGEGGEEKPAAAAKGEKDDATEDGEEDAHEGEGEGEGEAAGGGLDEKSLMTLLYPPTALKTPNQKRLQMVLLAELTREIRKNFNGHFDKIMSLKEEEVDKIEERNIRIQEILTELVSKEDFFKPSWDSKERPHEVLTVTDAEMTCKPYETEEMREVKRRAEEERKRREEESKKDNIGERALNDMMFGQLEIKKENVMDQELEPPAWAAEAGPEEEWTVEMVKEMEEFRAAKKALEDEREKQRKALELELKKLRTEVSDICKGFDEKVKDLADIRVQVQVVVTTQELYSLRLAMGIMETEDDLVLTARLDKDLDALRKAKNELSEQTSNWAEQVDAAKERLLELQEEDRAMERNFRKDISTASAEGIRQEDIKNLLVLYKQRRPLAADEPNGTGTGRVSAGRSSGRNSFRRSSVDGGGPRSSNLRNTATSLMQARRSSSRGVSERRSSKATGEGGAMGPLQLAMEEAIRMANKQRAAENDPFAEVEDKAKNPEAGSDAAPTIAIAPLSMERDLMDPLRSSIDEMVWDKLQELRKAKIVKEAEVKTQTALFNEMKKQVDALLEQEAGLASEMASLEAEKDALTSKVKLADRNLEMLVWLKQGQNELQQEAMVTDWSEGLLIPTTRVSKCNDTIKALGADKVQILHRIKKFRKSINYMEWEHSYMETQIKNLNEYFIDLQLLKVTKSIQAIMKGDTQNKAREKMEKAEARIEILKRVHGDKADKIKGLIAKLSQSVRERRSENERLVVQLKDLDGSVQVREAIYRSRVDSSGGEVNPMQQAATRMKRITMRRRLIDLARVQTEEIDFLRSELDRLRQRTFPSFAHAARNRLLLPPDEVV